MVRPGVPGHLARERPLIVAGFGEAETESLERPAATSVSPRGDRRHGARVDPSTQEQSDRDIADELTADRSLELRPDQRGPIGGLQALVESKRQIPVCDDSRLALR